MVLRAVVLVVIARPFGVYRAFSLTGPCISGTYKAFSCWQGYVLVVISGPHFALVITPMLLCGHGLMGESVIITRPSSVMLLRGLLLVANSPGVVVCC